MKFNKKDLFTEDLKAIESMLSQSSNNPPHLEDIWQLMDNVWDDLDCNNKDIDWDKINHFYAHPVWLLNGMFIEQDELSMQHRMQYLLGLLKITSKMLKIMEVDSELLHDWLLKKINQF